MKLPRALGFFLLAGLALGAGSCAGTGAPGVTSAVHVPMRVAHRGGAALAPENTLAAFRTGLENDADALELDIHLSKDGRLVVMHDASVDRTTDGRGFVADLTVPELKALDAGARFRGPGVGRQEIPLLEEVLELIAGSGNDRVQLQVEIKLRQDGSRYAGIEEELVSVLRDWSFIDRTTVLSFDFASLDVIHAIEPGLRTCALVGKDYFRTAAGRTPGQIAHELATLGTDSVGIREQNLTRRLFEALRREGLAVGAWTVDAPGRMHELAALGVYFITSNRPDLLFKEFPVAGRR